jgi:hypothetical protein
MARKRAAEFGSVWNSHNAQLVASFSLTMAFITRPSSPVGSVRVLQAQY